MRQNPDDLLRRIKMDEASADETQGRLKIFFGYAAGVGKTYAMLDAAHDALAQGFDVVVGYVEPHQRPATSALLEGLESIPSAMVQHKGIVLREFDLDAALERRPQIVLVDELAHTNADGCRHKKRYQDVEELLRAGINVYTTMNVQHLESLNDKVAAITQVPVHERVPDRVFDRAASVELIDIEPEELIERLNAGKIYKTDQARRALSHFFTKKNLAALREIALRRTADRLNRNSYASGLGAGEDVLLYVSERPGDVRAIRAAANMAQTYHGNLVALVVESSAGGRALGAEEERALRSNVALAEELGAHVVTVQGDDPAVQIAQYVPVAGNRPRGFGIFGKRRTLFRLRRDDGEALDAFSLGSLRFRRPRCQRGASRHGGTIAYFAFFITRCLDCFGCNCCLVLGRLRRVSDGVRIVGGADALFALYCDFRALRRHGDV